MSEPIAYMRDLDDTGSLHACSKGDPGAIPVYADEPGTLAKLERMREALRKIKALDDVLLHCGYDDGPGGGNYVYKPCIPQSDVHAIIDAALEDTP